MAVKLRIDSEYKDRGLKNARRDVGAFGNYATGVFKRLAVTFAGIFAFQKIKGFITSSIAAFSIQQKATESLTQSLAAAGDSASDYVPKLTAVASALQSISRVGDDVIMQTMAVGRSMGIAAENLDDAASAAVAFNKTFGIDMQTGMRGIALAFQGNTTQLGRYIPALRGITDAGEAYNVIMAMTNNLLKQQAGLSGTTTEKIQAIQLAWSDVKERFGEIFIASGFVTSALDEILLALEDIQAVGFKKWIEDTFPALDKWISKLENVGDVIDYLKHKPTPQEIIGSPFGSISEASILPGKTFPNTTPSRPSGSIGESGETPTSTTTVFKQTKEERRQELEHQRRMRFMEMLKKLRTAQTGLVAGTGATGEVTAARATSRSLSVGDLFDIASGSFGKNKPDGTKGNEIRVIVENADDVGGLSDG